MNKLKNQRHTKFNEIISILLLIITDIFVLLLSLIFGVLLVYFMTDNSSEYFTKLNLSDGLFFFLVLISIFIFLYEGIYTNRYDFWHETRIILKSLVLTFFAVTSIFIFINNSTNYPLCIFIYSFIFLSIFLPTSKYFLKIKLYEYGFWKRGVRLLSNNINLEEEIFGNHYLGYIKSKRKKAEFVFIDSSSLSPNELKNILERELQSKRKILFLPILNEYKFSNSNIYDLTNSRTSLIVFENKLKCKTRMLVNYIFNFLLALISVPLILPIVGIIAFLINQDSKGPIFYTQKRLGKDGKDFVVYKFRTMYTEDIQEKLLKDYLDENPNEIENYEIYCKYQNDPRITKVGNFLRKTSLDELAQIINVIKGDMNIVGPRPYLVNEKEKMGSENKDIILRVKPGITGLWQVSGRNELTFEERVNLEKWYVLNWSLWEDFVILMKTFGVVLNKVGAR